MKFIISTVIISLTLAGCSKAPEDTQSHNNAAVAPQEIPYPYASLQEDGSIMLYVKDTYPELDNKEVIAEHIIPPGTAMHQNLSNQLDGARVGVRVPVKSEQSE